MKFQRNRKLRGGEAGLLVLNFKFYAGNQIDPWIGPAKEYFTTYRIHNPAFKILTLFLDFFLIFLNFQCMESEEDPILCFCFDAFV